MKNITVVRGAGGPHQDLVIRPGTTSREILQQVGLNDEYVLRSGNNPEPFGADEVVFDAIQDGSKLLATTPVVVGTELMTNWTSLLKAPPWTELFIRRSDPIPTSAREVPTMVKGRVVVQRDTRPYWEKRGWKKDKNKYHGYFRTNYGSWRGSIEVKSSGRGELLIFDPPEALRHHSHWSCFHARPNNCYSVHHYGVYELSSAIVQIESMLVEAFQ